MLLHQTNYSLTTATVSILAPGSGPQIESTQAGNTLSVLEKFLSGLQPLTTSNAILHSWTPGEEFESISCLDSCEGKTEEEYADKLPVASSSLALQNPEAAKLEIPMLWWFYS